MILRTGNESSKQFLVCRKHLHFRLPEGRWIQPNAPRNPVRAFSHSSSGQSEKTSMHQPPQIESSIEVRFLLPASSTRVQHTQPHKKNPGCNLDPDVRTDCVSNISTILRRLFSSANLKTTSSSSDVQGISIVALVGMQLCQGSSLPEAVSSL